MTQKAKLLHYLETHDGITTLEAMQYLKCCRLSERVRELERLGYRISHTPEHTDNARVVRYRLLKVAPLPATLPGREYPAPSLAVAGGAASYKSWMR